MARGMDRRRFLGVCGAAGGALLLLPAKLGWPATFATAALLLVVLAGVIGRTPRVANSRLTR